MITKQDIGRTFLTKDGLAMEIINQHPDSESYFLAFTVILPSTLIYHKSGRHCDSIYGIPAQERPTDFGRWAYEPYYQAELSTRRKPLMVFRFDNSTRKVDAEAHLESLRVRIGHIYEIIGVYGLEMFIVDTEELKVTKVL